jgi:hypothetical protein
MVQVYESLFSTHSYPKQALWVYYIPSNLFLLLPPMSVSVDLLLFLYFQDDLKYHYVLMLQEISVGYDQISQISQISVIIMNMMKEKENK